MKRRFFSILLTLALCVGLLPVAAAPVHADAAEAYDLWIGGVQVTSENAADLSVIEGVDVVSGGEANYDAATNTLTLNGATIIDSASAVTDENYTQADTQDGSSPFFSRFRRSPRQHGHVPTSFSSSPTT